MLGSMIWLWDYDMAMQGYVLFMDSSLGKKTLTPISP